MRSGLTLAIAAASLAIGGMTPLNAAGPDASAEQLRRLDIMLMVSSLRCRNGADDFQADYGRFATRHLSVMNGAARQMQAQYTARYGAKGAKRAVDKVSVEMANQYGLGHPWLGCKELKQITRDLASRRPGEGLNEAASEYLATRPIDRTKLAARN